LYGPEGNKSRQAIFADFLSESAKNLVREYAAFAAAAFFSSGVTNSFVTLSLILYLPFERWCSA
jgi:hypothetical protein